MLTALHGRELRRYDVVSAFTIACLTEEVYMKQPPGYEAHRADLVCRLLKALYGLKQSPRAWQLHMIQMLQGWRFVSADADKLKHPAAKGCTDDDTLAIVPIYIPILD
jgi:hypothetical protein